MEAEENERRAEEIRIRELREKCEKKGLSFDEEEAKYQAQLAEKKAKEAAKAAHREAADPTLIRFKGRYYLFASMSAGFYYSDDMLRWQRHENRNLELYHYAPDVRQAGDWLIFCASDRRRSTIWRTKDPFAETYEKVSEPFAFWDPDAFVDDDGRVYFYWGCDSGRPIYGVASSFTGGHEPKLALNEDIRTSWCTKGSAGEWYQLDLGGQYTVRAVQLIFADVDVPVRKAPRSERSDIQTGSRYVDSGLELRTRWLLEGSEDGLRWFTLTDKRKADSDLANDCVFFEDGAQARYLRVTTAELPYGKKFALSGLRVFGDPKGAAPAKAEAATAERLDDTTASLRWDAAEHAVGYNVRYGIAPDKLYSSHMVYGESRVTLTMLNKGQEYFYAVDSFGEGGFTEGDVRRL